MRILMISDVYFPRVNGVSTSIHTTVRELQAAGHEVTLVAPAYPEPCYDDDASTIRLPSLALPFDPEDRAIRPWGLKKLWQRLATEGYDLVHIQTPFIAHYLGTALARRLGVPVIETYHTYFEEYLHNYIRFLPQRWLRAAARTLAVRQGRALDAMAVPSLAMLDVLRGYGVSCPARVIPTGVEPESFERGDGQYFRLKHGITPERPVLLFVGRVAAEKNIGFLIEVVDRLRATVPEVLLIIAGEGPAREELEHAVGRRGLDEHVLFVGYLDRQGELQDCYSAANAFVFASRTETQGLVLLEAMAQGVALVSTAVMGTAEVLAGCDGVLIAEEEVEDFVSKCQRVLTDHLLQRQLAQAARRHARCWSAEVLSRRLLELYVQLGRQPAPQSSPLPQTKY